MSDADKKSIYTSANVCRDYNCGRWHSKDSACELTHPYIKCKYEEVKGNGNCNNRECGYRHDGQGWCGYNKVKATSAALREQEEKAKEAAAAKLAEFHNAPLRKSSSWLPKQQDTPISPKQQDTSTSRARAIIMEAAEAEADVTELKEALEKLTESLKKAEARNEKAQIAKAEFNKPK